MQIDTMKLHDVIHLLSSLSQKLHIEGHDNVASKLLDIRQELLESIIDEDI